MISFRQLHESFNMWKTLRHELINAKEVELKLHKGGTKRVSANHSSITWLKPRNILVDVPARVTNDKIKVYDLNIRSLITVRLSNIDSYMAK